MLEAGIVGMKADTKSCTFLGTFFLPLNRKHELLAVEFLSILQNTAEKEMSQIGIQKLRKIGKLKRKTEL